jgi:hypothetical protein
MLWLRIQWDGCSTLAAPRIASFCRWWSGGGLSRREYQLEIEHRYWALVNPLHTSRGIVVDYEMRDPNLTC